jgi:hypothetical protein
VHAAQIGAGSDVIQPFKPNYAGWRDTPAKRQALQDYVTAQNSQLRLAAWKKMHAVFYSEVPSPMIGYFALLFGISTKLENFTPTQPPAFWNTRLAT